MYFTRIRGNERIKLKNVKWNITRKGKGNVSNSAYSTYEDATIAMIIQSIIPCSKIVMAFCGNIM